MRILVLVLTFIFFAMSSIAQTKTQKDNKPIKIKSYKLPPASNFNTWDIGGHIGFAYPYTDISSSGVGDFAFGVDVTKFLSHTFALQARIMHATVSGVDVNKPEYQFNTTINYDLTLNTIVQIGNISFLKKIPELAFYGSLGIGVVHYSPDVYIDGGNDKLTGVYSQYSQPLVEMDYQSTTDLMIPIGFGAKYHLSKNYSITAEYSYRTTNSDKLDGFFKLLSEDDNYSYFNVGFTYHLGTQSKTLEWENPLQTVYNDLYEMQEKLDLYNKDSDNDGVADLYDREPDTRPGSKVYGDGTSVDSDRDGVPDIIDTELFSEDNAKVDASGKSINSSKKISSEATEKPSIEKNITIIRKDNSKADQLEKNPIVPPAPEIAANQDEKNKYANYEDLPSVFFAVEEEKITSKHIATLDYVGHVMQNNPDVNYILIGNCDAVGSTEYNVNLGKRRAEAVKYYLIEKYSIKPIRLFIKPIGIVDGAKGSNPFNRRVDIKVKK